MHWADTKPILIGQTYVQSGPLASLATEPLVGIRAMLNAVNAAGGVYGRPIELKLMTLMSAARAAANVKQMASDGVVAILMPIGTTSSMGALQGRQ